MTRFARSSRVYYFEEPIHCADVQTPTLRRRYDASGVCVLTPVLSPDVDNPAAQLRGLLDELVTNEALKDPVLWYYTPMMLEFSSHLRRSCIVYDCMDELANFKFAPNDIVERERQLMARANVVFTGGASLFEKKRDLHANVHLFPSSVDVAHFGRARALRSLEGPATVRTPSLGFHGVIDERMDLELLAAIADARPAWTWVMVGPVVKIDPETLPKRPNIQYVGAKSYDELPTFLANWNVAIMPFAINDATRFISPTKTPEYFAGGLPVVSTPVRDVVTRYGNLAGLHIGATAAEFIYGCEAALALTETAPNWLAEADAVLARDSWDTTFARMEAEVRTIVAPNRPWPIRGVTSVTRKLGPQYDYLIVGAGFAGSVLAERLASGSNKKVLVIDRRDHIGGNAYDEYDEAGILVHRYGPHIFHTNSDRVLEYLSRFTKWRAYEHRVLASIGDKLVPIPINRTTLNLLYGAGLQTEKDVETFLAQRVVQLDDVRTSKDILLSTIGTELYETFFRCYTQKQWGMDPSQLDKAVAARVPVRTCTDDRYFTDKHQCMPLHGYTRMFENLLDHKNITVMPGVSFNATEHQKQARHTIFSGPIDEYFGLRFGPLAYRSLTFRRETLNQRQFQAVGVVNYPSANVEYTRITEYKHLTGQDSNRTSLTYEIPSATGEPYYPIPSPVNQQLYATYVDLAASVPNVTFVGRLGTYKYYNMDQVVGQALATYKRLEPEAAATAPLRLDQPRLVAYA